MYPLSAIYFLGHTTSVTDEDTAKSPAGAVPLAPAAARNALSVSRSDAIAVMSSSTYSGVAAGRAHVRRASATRVSRDSRGRWPLSHAAEAT